MVAALRGPGRLRMFMIKFFKKLIPAWLILLPYTAWGLENKFGVGWRVRWVGGSSGGGGLWNLFSIVMKILNQVVILLVGFAVVFFFMAY